MDSRLRRHADRALREAARAPERPLCFSLGVTGLAGLIAHAYGFLNASFSHDGTYLTQADDAWQFSLGRTLIPVYRALRSHLSMPWLMGCLSLLYIGLAAYLTASLLRIRSRAGIAAVCCLFVTNVAVTAVFATYLNCADAYMLALLFSAAGVWLFRRGGRAGFAAGALALAGCMALYQAYISAAIGLLLLLLVADVLDGAPARQTLLRALSSAALLLCAAALYLGIVAAGLRLARVGLSDAYNSISAVGDFGGVSLPALALAAYRNALDLLFKTSGHQTAWCVRAAWALLLLAAAALARAVFRARPGKAACALLALFLLALPFGVNFVYFLSKGVTHQLMVFPVCLLCLLPLLLLERRMDGAADASARLPRFDAAAWAATLLCFAVVAGSGAIFANGAYLRKDLQGKAGLSMMTRVADRIEAVEGYVPGETPVALVGLLERHQDAYAIPEFSRFNDVIGLNVRLPVTYYATYKNYFDFILQRPLLLLPDEECLAFAARQDVLDMPAFPREGCARLIDGTLVMKLSTIGGE